MDRNVPRPLLSGCVCANSFTALDSRGVLRDIIQLVVIDAQLAVSRRTSMHCSAFAKRATVASSHLITIALLQLILLEPTRAADGKTGRMRSCVGLFNPERRDGKRRRHPRKKFDRRASVTPVRDTGPGR